MNSPYQSLVSARILAIEAASGRTVVRRFTKAQLAESLFHLHVTLRQKPGGLRDRVFQDIWTKCRSARGLDVEVGTADIAAAVGVKREEHVRLATIWLEQHGLIVRLTRRGSGTRYAICLLPPTAEAA